MFYKYPSLAKLEQRRGILTVVRVVATEKLHGSNFRIYFKKGILHIEEVQYGSREHELGTAGSAQCNNFHEGKPVGWFQQRPELLERLIRSFQRRNMGDTMLVGEICGTSIQNGVLYVPRHDVMFRAFDIQTGPDTFVEYSLFTEICDEVGMPRVPQIYAGPPSLEVFNSLLERPSKEAELNGIADGCNVSEGVVIRADPLQRDHRGHYLLIKHKSKKFDECVKAGIEQDRIRLGPTVAFARSVVTRGRLLNVRGHLRDANTPFDNDMRDMQYMGPAILTDLHKECQDDWDALMAEGFLDKEVEKAVRAQMNAAYRELLVEEGFNPIPPARVAGPQE